MVMRRIRSAPANIAMMTNTKKTPNRTVIHEEEGCNIEGYKDTAINELISCCASDIEICDSTEQLAITLFAKLLKEHQNVDIDIVTVCRNVMFRLVATYVTHHITLATLRLLHNCETNLPNLCDSMLDQFVHTL